MTRKLLAFVLVAVLVAGMTLGIVPGVNTINARIAQIGQPLWRAAASLAEVAAAIAWLLAIVFVATRLSVLIFAGRRRDAGS